MRAATRAGSVALAAAVLSAASTAQTRPASDDGVTTREVRFYSEAVQCFARIYVPKGVTADSKAPAVVLAPGWGDTEAAIDKFAARFAARGIVAMAIDFRGWGRSGGFLYLGEPIRWDDRLRFSQHTARLRIRRRRLLPEAQLLDIRNAISYLQGEPGVDRARIGVWGVDMAGGHALVVAATDARVKAAVAQTPIIGGRNMPRRAFAPSAELQQAMVKLARGGQAPALPGAAAVMNEQETKLALAEYHPFWFADQVPQTTAVLFVIAGRDERVDNDAHAAAAAKLLKGPNGITTVPDAGHALGSTAAFEAAAEAAASWFQKYL